MNNKYIRLNKDIHRMIKLHSADIGVSMTEIVNKVLSEFGDVNNLDVYINDPKGTK